MVAAFKAEQQRHDAHQERLAVELIEATQQLKKAKSGLARTIAGLPLAEAMDTRAGT